MENTNTVPVQDVAYTIGNAKFVVERVFDGQKTIRDLIKETITTKNTKA